MSFLDPWGLVARHSEKVVAVAANLPGVAAGEADGHGADLARRPEPIDDVGRAPRGGEADDDITGLGECDHLPGEGHLERIVVSYGRHARTAVGQRERGEWRAVLQVAPDELASDVRGLSGASPIAHEYCLATLSVGHRHRRAGGGDPSGQLRVRGEGGGGFRRSGESPGHELLDSVSGHWASRSGSRAARRRTPAPTPRSRREPP